MEVEFVTLGDASERLGVPSPTLRNWTDQLEDMGIHYVKRNNRNERVYYDNDIEIFKWISDLKKEHGRKTTMRDLTNVMREMTDRFQFRGQEEAPTPTPNPSNKTGELLTPDDVSRLMDNQRVRAILGVITAHSTEEIRMQMVAELRGQFEQERDILKLTLREEIKREMLEGSESLLKELQEFNEAQSKRDEEERKHMAERDEKLMSTLKELQEMQEKMNEQAEIEAKERKEQEEKKGFFKRMFGM